MRQGGITVHIYSNVYQFTTDTLTVSTQNFFEKKNPTSYSGAKIWNLVPLRVQQSLQPNLGNNI